MKCTPIIIKFLVYHNLHTGQLMQTHFIMQLLIDMEGRSMGVAYIYI